MGTWDTGNFDNDGALDYVAEIVDQLVARIEECFDEPGSSDLDEDGETILVPSVAILSVLHERCGAAPPKAEAVAEWRARYLALFDDQIDDLEPAEGYAEARRKVIGETFATLEAQSRAFWRED